MDVEEYRDVYRALNSLEDIDRVAKKRGISADILYVIYSQKVTRDATKRFHLIKRKMPSFLEQWKRGESLVHISQKERFPPMLFAYIMAQEMGIGKKRFWRIVKGEERTHSKRLKHELELARGLDKHYSPEANEEQDARGVWGETLMAEWLDSKNIVYKTEEDLRSPEGGKTPDFLLDKPLKINGLDVRWIESKALFGDSVEYKRHLKKQLVPYWELYGPGIVVYWFGFVSDLKKVEDIGILDKSYFYPDE